MLDTTKGDFVLCRVNAFTALFTTFTAVAPPSPAETNRAFQTWPEGVPTPCSQFPQVCLSYGLDTEGWTARHEWVSLSTFTEIILWCRSIACCTLFSKTDLSLASNHPNLQSRLRNSYYTDKNNLSDLFNSQLFFTSARICVDTLPRRFQNGLYKFSHNQPTVLLREGL